MLRTENLLNHSIFIRIINIGVAVVGREFIDMFDEWANHYDHTVVGQDEQYKDVFQHYEQILEEVVERSGNVVIEFGSGTGNLTKNLLNKGKQIYCIEPSEMMRRKAEEKLGNSVHIQDGDFLSFPVPNKNIDTIVSTYAFHHLTDEEKDKAIHIYSRILHTGGKIVFADTAFINQQRKEKTIERAKRQGYMRLAEDLQTEYYTTHGILKGIFNKHHFEVAFKQMNSFVWLMEAVKQ